MKQNTMKTQKRKDSAKSARAATANVTAERAKETAKTMVKLADFVENPDNPSTATDEEIQRLAGKLKRVPLGLKAHRIAYVTDDPQLKGKGKVLGGNKRLRCLKAAFGENGEVPADWFQDITEMSEAERHEFIVDDNTSDGSWDVDKLLAQYDRAELGELMGAEAVDALLADVAASEAAEKSGDGDDGEINAETGFRYKEQYGVIVMCKDEHDQEQIYSRLVAEGYECKVVAT